MKCFLLYWFGMDQLVGCFINAVIISIIKQPGDHPHITYLQPFLPAVHARWNINRIILSEKRHDGLVCGQRTYFSLGPWEAQCYRMVNLWHKGIIIGLWISFKFWWFLQPKSPILILWFFDNFSNKNGQNDDFLGLKLLKIMKIDHPVALWALGWG